MWWWNYEGGIIHLPSERMMFSRTKYWNPHPCALTTAPTFRHGIRLKSDAETCCWEGINRNIWSDTSAKIATSCLWFSLRLSKKCLQFAKLILRFSTRNPNFWWKRFEILNTRLCMTWEFVNERQWTSSNILLATSRRDKGN